MQLTSLRLPSHGGNTLFRVQTTKSRADLHHTRISLQTQPNIISAHHIMSTLSTPLPHPSTENRYHHTNLVRQYYRRMSDQPNLVPIFSMSRHQWHPRRWFIGHEKNFINTNLRPIPVLVAQGRNAATQATKVPPPPPYDRMAMRMQPGCDIFSISTFARQRPYNPLPSDGLSDDSTLGPEGCARMRGRRGNAGALMNSPTMSAQRKIDREPPARGGLDGACYITKGERRGSALISVAC